MNTSLLAFFQAERSLSASLIFPLLDCAQQGSFLGIVGFPLSSPKECGLQGCWKDGTRSVSFARPPRDVLGWAGAAGQAASVDSQHRTGVDLLAVIRSLPFDLARAQTGPWILGRTQ